MTRPPEPWRLDLVFEESLRDVERLCNVLDRFAAGGFPIDKIDDVEPIERPYSRQTIQDMLAPRAPELPCRALTGISATTFVSIRCCDLNASGDGIVNHISINTKRVTDHQIHALLRIALDLFASHELRWGALDRASVFDSQRMPGTIYSRLPGIFWWNAFSSTLVEAIGEEKLFAVPWVTADKTEAGTLAWLYSNPLEFPSDLVDRWRNARELLGQEKFIRDKWRDIPPKHAQ